MMEKNEVLHLHEYLNRRFWGASGLRDERALEAALCRPYATFAGQQLYAGPVEKAAALLESMVKNHPFVEGNMRTGYVLMRLLLEEANLSLQASAEERHQFVLQVATSTLDYAGMVAWLEQQIVEG